jgi:MFS family permease
MYCCLLTQAMIGVAFSVGFVVGPLIGAYFSVRARSYDDGSFFVSPALFALALAVLNVLFMLIFLRETLPAEKRVNNLNLDLEFSLVREMTYD